MGRPNQYLALVGLLFSPLYSYGASFDCSKASTSVEKTICADPQLSDLDELLMASYKKALSNTSGAAPLKMEQKDWLKSVRDMCQDKECLKKAYTSRLATLNDSVASSSKPFAISGEYERYYHGKPDYHSSSITLRELGNGQVHVEGNATWVGNAATGNVNVGELDGTFVLDGSKILYTDGGDEACKLTISLIKNGMDVSDDNMRCGGHNVTFNGQYRKKRRSR